MKWLLKILAAPVVALLALFISLCGLILMISARLFGLLGAACGLLGIVLLLTGTTKNGVIVLVIAFLVSPSGLPMLAAWLLGQLQRFRFIIQDRLYG